MIRINIVTIRSLLTVRLKLFNLESSQSWKDGLDGLSALSLSSLQTLGPPLSLKGLLPCAGEHRISRLRLPK